MKLLGARGPGIFPRVGARPRSAVLFNTRAWSHTAAFRVRGIGRREFIIGVEGRGVGAEGIFGHGRLHRQVFGQWRAPQVIIPWHHGRNLGLPRGPFVVLG